MAHRVAFNVLLVKGRLPNGRALEGGMARERKSARELAKIIAERMKIEPSLVSVRNDPVYVGR